MQESEVVIQPTNARQILQRKFGDSDKNVNEVIGILDCMLNYTEDSDKNVIDMFVNGVSTVYPGTLTTFKPEGAWPGSLYVADKTLLFRLLPSSINDSFELHDAIAKWEGDHIVLYRQDHFPFVLFYHLRQSLAAKGYLFDHEEGDVSIWTKKAQ